MAVADIIKDQDDLKAHSHNFALWPRQWQTYTNIHDWTICKFTGDEKNKVPDRSGIYTFLVQPGIANHPAASYLMYIGQTISLHRRFGDYLNEAKRETGRPKLLRLLNKYANNLWFCYTLVPEDALDSVEDGLTRAYIPPANDQFPAEIRRIVGAFR